MVRFIMEAQCQLRSNLPSWLHLAYKYFLDVGFVYLRKKDDDFHLWGFYFFCKAYLSQRAIWSLIPLKTAEAIVRVLHHYEVSEGQVYSALVLKMEGLVQRNLISLICDPCFPQIRIILWKFDEISDKWEIGLLVL